MSIERPTEMSNCRWPLARVARGWERVTLQARGHTAIRHLARIPLGSIQWAQSYGWLTEEMRTQALTEEDQGEALALLQQAVGIWIPWLRVTDVRIKARPDEESMEIVVHWFVPDYSYVNRESTTGPYTTTVLM